MLAATFIAPITTVGLILMSFFLLVKKSFSQSGTDFSYGVCTAWFLLGSQLLLATGVELTANKHHTSTWEAGAWWVWSRSGEAPGAGQADGSPCALQQSRLLGGMRNQRPYPTQGCWHPDLASLTSGPVAMQPPTPTSRRTCWPSSAPCSFFVWVSQ